MIVNINSALLPLTADLEFPLGLAKGEIITLIVNDEATVDFKKSYPKANDVFVDPVTKVLYLGRTADSVDTSSRCGGTDGVACEASKLSCDDCSFEYSSTKQILRHRDSNRCLRSNIQSCRIELAGEFYKIELNRKQSKKTQVEMALYHGSHRSSLVQKVNEANMLTLSSWNSVPSSFYEACIQIATKLLLQLSSRSAEVSSKVRTKAAVTACQVRATVLEVDADGSSDISFDSIYRHFERFIAEHSTEQSAMLSTAPDFDVNVSESPNERCQGSSANKRSLKRLSQMESALNQSHSKSPVTSGSQVSNQPVTVDASSPEGDKAASNVPAAVEENAAETLGDFSVINDSHDKKLYCPLCMKINRHVQFTNPQALEIHIENNHSVQVVEAAECGKCSKRFVTPEALQTHEKKCNPKFPKKCQVCGKSFSMGLHRDRHLREVHGIVKEHSCGICGSKYQSEKHRDWHIVTKHKDLLSAEEFQRLGMEEIQCTLCDFRSYSSKGMQVHRQKAHIENEKPFRCPACAVGNDTLAGIQEHINQRHGADDKWWVCHICNRTFNRENMDGINFHLERHSQADGVTCGHCNKMFENDTFMLDHVTRNHLKTPMHYICDICDQGTQSYRDLLKHMLKHNPFKTSLYRLQRQHIDKRNLDEGLIQRREKRMRTVSIFDCEVCGKQFDLEATLISHRIVNHDDPGKEFYRCPVCNKAFKPHHLPYHMRLHSKERPHKCRYCDACFHTVASCTDHEIIKHTFAYKMFCPKCEKGFVSRAKTWQHLIRFHKETPECADKLLPPITHKTISVLQKRRQTEEIKNLIGSATALAEHQHGQGAVTIVTGISNSRVLDETNSPSSSKKPFSYHVIPRFGESEFLGCEERPEIDAFLAGEMEIAGHGLGVTDTAQGNAKRLHAEVAPTDLCVGAETCTAPAEELREQCAEVNTNVAFPEVDCMPTSVYPQPELGPDMYRVVLPNGSETTLQLEPGQQVVLEDGQGHQQIIQLQGPPTSSDAGPTNVQ